ncbi:MAG: hypothetical protein BWY09_02553 [Candidatus Hydrogenedentes bacterium ADurb.Bin179]|nr:MAG: hypothetical protein BWY09_02553 [Candidatus Hydrogenedentes bacterium ADurb.Bin179]
MGAQKMTVQPDFGVIVDGAKPEFKMVVQPVRFQAELAVIPPCAVIVRNPQVPYRRNCDGKSVLFRKLLEPVLPGAPVFRVGHQGPGPVKIQLFTKHRHKALSFWDIGGPLLQPLATLGQVFFRIKPRRQHHVLGRRFFPPQNSQGRGYGLLAARRVLKRCT